MQKAAPIFNDNTEGGIFLVTSSVAGIGATGSSMPYSVTKAAGSFVLISQDDYINLVQAFSSSNVWHRLRVQKRE